MRALLVVMHLQYSFEPVKLALNSFSFIRFLMLFHP